MQNTDPSFLVKAYFSTPSIMLIAQFIDTSSFDTDNLSLGLSVVNDTEYYSGNFIDDD